MSDQLNHAEFWQFKDHKIWEMSEDQWLSYMKQHDFHGPEAKSS